MEKPILNNVVIIPTEIPVVIEDQVRESFKKRFLDYDTHLKECTLLKAANGNSCFLKWNYQDDYNRGELICTFNLDGSAFKHSNSWSQRMRDLNK